MSTEKSIRIISFTGKKQDWRKWSRKFLAMAVKRGYKDVLLGVLKTKGSMTDEEKVKNGHAYNDIMLSMNEDVSFGLVDEACSEEMPEGDSALAWKRLEAKYDSQTNSSKVKLMKQLNKSKLKSKDDDPDHWVSELEVIRARLKKMKVSIEDDYFMMHILNNLPDEYDNLVDTLEDKIDAKSDPLTLESLREKLSSKYEKLQDKGDELDEDAQEVEEETALAGFGSFKGRCYVCGKFGHKGSECPDRANQNGTKKFAGKCNYCGKKGHKEAQCWKKKKDEERKNARGSTANVARDDDSEDGSEDEAMSLICQEIKPDYKIEESSMMCFESCCVVESDEEESDEDMERESDGQYEDHMTDIMGDILRVEEEESSMHQIDVNDDRMIGSSDTRSVQGTDIELDNQLADDEPVDEDKRRSWGPQPTRSGWGSVVGNPSNVARAGATTGGWDRVPVGRIYRPMDYRPAWNPPRISDPRCTGESKDSDPPPSVRKFTDDELQKSCQSGEEWRRDMFDIQIEQVGTIHDDVEQESHQETDVDSPQSMTDIIEGILELRRRHEQESEEDNDDHDHERNDDDHAMMAKDGRSYGWMRDESEDDEDSSGTISNCGDDTMSIEEYNTNHGIEKALESHDSTLKTLEKDIWVADSGASSHMTNSLEGMTDLRESKSYVTFGDSKRLKVSKIGTKHGVAVQKNGEIKKIAIRNVKYVPDLYCNLFSLTSAMRQGYELIGSKMTLTMKKRNYRVHFDRTIKSGQGFLFGLKIVQGTSSKQPNPTRRENVKKKKVISRMDAHRMFGHSDDVKTEASATKHGYKLTGTYQPCQYCLKAKARQKNVNKSTTQRSKRKGDLMYFDISSVQKKSAGGTKFWNLVLDDHTDMKFSLFLKKKSDLSGKGVELVKKLRNRHGVVTRSIRCDNAGENYALGKGLDNADLQVKMEYTATGTPQQNGRVERAFATLYGRMRAMFNDAGIGETMKGHLWAEAANMATQIDNVLVKNSNKRTPFEKFTGTKPRYARNLRAFGDMCIVLDQSKKKIRSKLDNRGILGMMVGYHDDHAGDVYRLYNPKTKRIMTSRDVRWLNKLYGAYYSEQDTGSRFAELGRDMSDSDESSDSEDEGATNQLIKPVTRAAVPPSHRSRRTKNPRLNNALKKLNTSYNPTIMGAIALNMMEPMEDFAFVGGTDDDYRNPSTFQEAWHHPNEEDRRKWREAIRKEFRDMIAKRVWRNMKRRDVPSDRRLIGSKWVFKRKRNGVFRARLCALGYSQIPGIDHQDNFAPVITDVTFRVLMVMALVYSWHCEIVDVETAFLYGDLDEEIFMKIPEGLNEYLSETGDDKVMSDDTYGDDDCFILDKSMYGLVQAARQFYKKMIDVMTKEMGFKKCLSDQCLLMRINDKGTVIIGLYIDDNLCCGDALAIEEFKKDLKKHFNTKEEGEMEEYVGCQVFRKGDMIWMYQEELIKKLEKYFGDDVRKMREYDTPAGHLETIQMVKDDEPSIDVNEQTRYRSGVGMLLYLVKFSRPDLSNCVRELSKANSKANDGHFKSLLRVIKYVLITKSRSLVFKHDSMTGGEIEWKLTAYSDSDWAGDKDSRHSITGYNVYLNNKLIAWKSRSQKNITLSSTEAEYVAVSEVCNEIMFVKSILEFMGIKVTLPIEIYCDNVGAIFLSYNPKTGNRTKHIDVKFHHVREFILDGTVVIKFVKSEHNDADIHTKNTNRETYHRHESKFNSRLHHE